MSKRLVLYAPYALWSPHFETDLELVERHLDEGYEVTLLVCEAQLPTCEPNVEHSRWRCNLCRSRNRAGIAWLGRDRVRVEEWLLLTAEQKAVVEGLRQVELATTEELRDFRLDGSDLGAAALSSLVDATGEARPDLLLHRDLAIRNLQAAARVHFSIRNHLREKRPDRFILFNGRWAAMRPALRAAQALGVHTLVHERGGYLDEFSLTENTYPHDLEWSKRQLAALWEAGAEPVEERRKIGAEWFEERMQRRTQNWAPFAAGQARGQLPEELERYRLRIGVFLSTESEFVTISGWENPFYVDQNEGLARLLADSASLEGVGFFARMHPGMRGVENSQTRELHELAARYPNLFLIPPESPVDSYALMEGVDVVLTYGSTITIEALYLERPCILMGRSVVEDAGAVIRPRGHDELMSIVRGIAAGRPLATAGSREVAVRYGYMQRRLGTRFRYLRPKNVFDVTIRRGAREERIRASLWSRLLYRVMTAPARLRGAA